MFKLINPEDAPRRAGRGKGEYRFAATPEWRELKAVLDAGLPEKKKAQVLFSPKDQKKWGITNRRTLFRFVKKYIEDNKLKLQVKSYKRGDDFLVVVQHPE